MRVEYKRCLEDPIYFMKKYVKIQHIERGTIPFELYPFQEETLNSFIKNDKNIVLKSRQMGISTLVSAYSLWLMVFKTDKNVVVISRTQDATKDIVTKVRFSNEHLPSWLRVECIEDNRLSLRFKNGSQIKAISSSAGAARGNAASLLILDECAHIENADKVWVAANATTSTGGKAILLSTPNGVGDFFHKMWTEAESGENGFVTVKLPWNLHPDRDEEWREKAGKEQGDKREAAQEYDCDFTTSGNTVIAPEILKSLKLTLKDPVEKRWAEQGLWIWERPKDTVPYLVCGDVSRGDSTDKSAFHIIRLDTCEQVAEYRGVVDTKSYGNLLVSVAVEYNKAILVVENNNIGWATIQQILDLEYPALFYSSKDFTYIDVEQQLVGKINKMEKNMIPGFSTTVKTRPLIISKLEMYLREKAFVLNSIRTWEELSTFIWNTNGKAEAMRGYNDDLVMALAIGLWVRDTALRYQTQASELTKASLNGISMVKSDIQTIYSSRNEIAKKAWQMPLHSGGKNAYGKRNTQIGTDNTEDMTWLL